MTVRQSVRKRPRRVNGAKRTIRSQKSNEPLCPKEQRQLVQLMVCGGVFVLLVGIKLLFPGRMAALDRALSGAMEHNIDVEAVFSAIGGAFREERPLEDTVEEVYQAVLNPREDVQLIKTTALPQMVGAMELLGQYRPVPETSAASSEIPETPEVETLAYVLYSDRNLPECVSMEQAILDFAYCSPVEGTLTSEFGYRKHPVEGEERFHYGIDLAAPSGAPIVAFADGTVSAVGESSSYGKYCILLHRGGYATLYAHCKRITVSSGASVAQGDKIAEVGESGAATGSHLHFELQREGTYLNPIYYVSAA